MKLLTTLFLTLLGAQGFTPPERPRDPFVFRCVLDRKVRIVTLALSPEMYVAYDTSTCGLYKAWKGGVHFDGPVYTSVHGPQPTSYGPSYTTGFDGIVWSAEVAGKEVMATPHYGGYTFDHGRAVLLWDVHLPDGRSMRVHESPEFVHPESLFGADERENYGFLEGFPGLWRSFRAEHIPDDVKLRILARTDGTAGSKLVERAEREQLIDIKDEKGNVTATEIRSLLVLTKQYPTNNLIMFFEPLAAVPEPTEPAKTKPAHAEEPK